MRRLSSSASFSIVIAASALLTVLACSSKNDAPPAADPETSTSSSGGSSGDDDAGATSTSSSGSAPIDAAEEPKVEWVKTTNETMMLDGAQRQYYLSVPLNFDAAKSYPLYIFMHGNPGTSQQVVGLAIENVTHDEAIIVYPSSKSTDGWDLTAAEQDNADTAFLLALIDELAANKSVDKTKVLLSGYSGGGFMSSAMGCRFYASFKMIGIHAGGAPFNETGNPDCDGAQVPTLVTHGNLDNNVGPTSGFYAAEYWRQHNGCDSTTTATTPAPCVKYDNCAAGEPVTYCLRPNEGHEFWSKALEVEWAFFKALP